MNGPPEDVSKLVVFAKKVASSVLSNPMNHAWIAPSLASATIILLVKPEPTFTLWYCVGGG